MRLSAAGHCAEDVHLLSPGHEPRALGDARRRLQLVTRQHPDLEQQQHANKAKSWRGRSAAANGRDADSNVTFADLYASISQQLKSRSDSLLKLVFHARQTQQLHVSLKALDHGRNLGAALLHTQLGLLVARL